MPSLDTGLAALCGRAVDSVIDLIAKDGVEALTRVLEEEGFAGNERVQGYEVLAHVLGGEVWFEVVIGLDALDEASQAEVAEPAPAEEPPAGARTFKKDAFGAVSRLLSYNDGRRDARRRAINALQPAARPPKHLRSALKGTQIRSVQRELAAHAPRSLRVDTRSNRVSLRLKSMVHGRSPEGDTFTYRKGKYEGAVSKFLDRLSAVVSKRFAAELEKIIARRAA